MAKYKGKLSSDLVNFTLVHNEFIESPLLNVNEKVVFLSIKRHLNNESLQAFPSIKTLCRYTGLSRSTVIKTIKSLEDKGVLSVERRQNDSKGNLSNLYTLIDTKELWRSRDERELAELATAQKYEWAKQIIEAAGYQVVEKKELADVPTKAHQQASQQFSIYNIIKKDQICQVAESTTAETYSMDWIRRYYGYEIMIGQDPAAERDIDSVINLLYDTLNTTKKTLRIGGESKPVAVVKSRLLKLTYEHIIYAIEQYRSRTERIRNQRSYMLTILYQAYDQMGWDYSNRVRHDMSDKND